MGRQKYLNPILSVTVYTLRNQSLRSMIPTTSGDISGDTMRCTWAFVTFGLILQFATQAVAEEYFDQYQCKRECAFRYGIRRDDGGMIKVPSSSTRWFGYLKCVDECERKSTRNMFGPGED